MKICSVCYRCYEDRIVHCADESHQALLESRDGDIEVVSGYQLEVLKSSTARENVFLARHVASARSCVIKLIRASADRVKDFLRDAEIASTLFHPNVVDIYETGQLDNGDLFVVTEDESGQTLRETFASGIPDLMTAIRIATEAATAIHTLHLKSLVHRAMRPENIVLAHDDQGALIVRIKEADLGGIAQHAIVSDKFTIDSARDQLRYFAPEQCNNEAISIKTDVYSLGIVLYEMLAGRPPFDSPKASGLIEMHRHRRPAEIKINDFELRMLVTHTLMQSLSKHPSDRQSSANAFARQLRHVEQLATHVSTPPPAGIIPPEPVRSSPRIHISDAGLARDLVVAPQIIEPVHAENAADLFVRGDESRNAAEPVIEMPPASEVIAQNAPLPRQWLSPLKLQRKRSRGESKRRTERLPEIRAKSEPPFESQTFCLDDTAKKTLKIGRKPVKVDWEQPDDDIPSLEAVVAARAEMPVLSDDPILASVPQPVVEKAKPIAVPTPAKVRVAAAAVTSAGFHLSGIFGTEHHEADEITAAPRGNPIRIDIAASKPVSDRKPSRSTVPIAADESSYFPTILGSGVEATDSSRSNSLLFAFYDAESPHFGWSIQKLTLASGVIAAAAAIFAFSNMSAWRNFSSSPVDDRLSVSTASTDSVQQQATVTTPQSSVTKKPLKYFDSPKPKTNASMSSEPKSDASKLAAGKNQPASVPKIDKKDTAGTPFADRNKSSTKAVPAKRAPDRSVTASSNKPTATTRPRIVKNPRQ